MTRFALSCGLALAGLVWCPGSMAAEVTEVIAAMLSSRGLGPVRFGSPLASLPSRLGPPMPASELQDPDCRHVTFPALPGATFMVEHGKVTRAEAGPGVPNVLGVRLGDPLDSVRRHHPRVQLWPHAYDPHGHELIFPSPDHRTAVVMEEIGGTVTAIRAGLLPSVRYVEGCV